MEFHLEEAAFLWTQWEHSAWAPDHALLDVESGDEGRLLAHLDALVLGGKSVAERLLLPALEGDEPEAVRAAAWALLSAEDADWLGTIRERLVSGPPELDESLLRAFELSRRADVCEALQGFLPQLPPDRKARVVAALRFRGVDPSPWLSGLTLKEDAGLRMEAMRAARWQPRAQAVETLRRGLADPEPLVREAALWTGLVLRMRVAWDECRQLAKAPPLMPRISLLTLAVSGVRQELESLLSLLSTLECQEEVLWALGFSGRVEAADAAFRLIEERGSRLAAESFAAITGMPLRAPFIEEGPSAEEELDAPPELPDVPVADTLPGPATKPGRAVADVVARWWAKARKGFERGGRYLRGRPWSEAALLAELESGPLRRRPALLAELEIRTGGRLRVDPRAWTAEQRHQMEAVAQLPLKILSSSLEKSFFW